jgi:hypothetical protein
MIALVSQLERCTWGGATLLVGGCVEAPVVPPSVRGRPGMAGGDSPLAPSAVPPPRPDFPLLARPAPDSACDLTAWARAARRLLDERLTEVGAVLLRGLPIASSEEFAAFRSALDYPATRYSGIAVRREVAPDVWTVNALTGERTIMLHNELPYERVVPRQLFFFCESPPAPDAGGETPIARNADWHTELGEAVISRLAARGLVRRLTYPGMEVPGAPQRSWQGHFGTRDRSEVERVCREEGMDLAWQADGGLTIRREQVTTIEVSGRRLWFCSPQAAPRGSLCYRDGSELEPELMERLYTSQWKIAVAFSWQRSDVLCLDNVLCQHGRLPHAAHSARKLFVSLGAPFEVRPWPTRGGRL